MQECATIYKNMNRTDSVPDKHTGVFSASPHRYPLPPSLDSFIVELETATAQVRYLLDLDPDRRDRAISNYLATNRIGLDADILRTCLAYLIEVNTSTGEVLPSSRFDVENIQVFLSQAIDVSHEARGVRARDLYRAYAKWCQQHGVSTTSESTFGRIASRLLPRVERSSGRWYVMVKFRDDSVGVEVLETRE